jgi:DNA-binding NtrC family response regulator
MKEIQKILVVEDEPVVRSLCRAALKHYGFEPVMANDGVEGLETYRFQYPEISLVLSDVMMPRMNGIEMVDKIFLINPHANVILMTGYDCHVEVPVRLQKVCELLGKPFSVQELLGSVRKCLESQALRHPQLSST